MELTGVGRAGSGPWSLGFTMVVLDSIFHLLLSGYNVNHLAPSSGCLCVRVLMRLFTASFLPAMPLRLGADVQASIPSR